MAIGRVAFRTHCRARGHTAAAALAYRYGANLRDHHGQQHDFRRRARADEVLATGLSAPNRWAHGADLQALSDCIEQAERRKDARLCRDVQLAVPHELSRKAQTALVERYADWLQQQYDTPVAWALHAPDPANDSRNIHAHLILPSRALSDDGAAFAAKLRVLDCPGTAAQEITKARNVWGDFANEALARAGIDASVNVGQRLPEGGHARYARAATTVIRWLPLRAKALLNDVRRLLTNRPDADGGLVSSSIFVPARRYWALAYARAPMRQWPLPNFRDASGVGAAIAQLIALWQGPKSPTRSLELPLQGRPRKIKRGAGRAEWGAAIQNPPATLAVGDCIDIETRRGRLRSAEIEEIKSRTMGLAVVRTGPQAEILLRAAGSSGEVVEVRREADRSLTITGHGRFGRLKNGVVTLSASRIGDELAQEFGSRTAPTHRALRRIAEVLQNDGASILYSTSPEPEVITGRPTTERSRKRSRRSKQAHAYDAAWAEDSFRAWFQQQAETDAADRLNEDP